LATTSAEAVPAAGAAAAPKRLRFDRTGRALHWLRRSVLPFALLIAVWWVVKLIFGLNSTILPSPAEAATSSLPLLQRGILPDYVSSSLSRIAVAGVLGIAGGVPLGLLLGSNRWVSIAFAPMLNFFQALSGIAWLPLMLVWFGFGERTIQAVILYTVIFPVAFNTMIGVRTVPMHFANGLRVLGAGRLRLLRDVWIPGALPSILLGIRLGVAYGWRALIAGEMVVGAGGIGFLLFQARQFHQTARILDGMILLGLLWLMIDLGFLRPLERYTVERWGMVQR
jgi:NitT/TauT family transport system permease protein/taurine transport system permease protein